jgi:predicted tellurium resistance membrane protein TerC
MGWLNDPQIWASLLTLTALEIVLGIDNLMFITILAGRLPVARQNRARQVGLGLALITRLALLASIAWIISLTQPVFEILGRSISWRDLILIGGGFFLLYKGTREIHHRIEGDDLPNEPRRANASFVGVITQIVVLDIVFSLDSVITAVGMANEFWVMATAIVIAVLIMLAASGPVSDRHDAGRRRRRFPCPERVHLCRDRLFCGRRSPEPTRRAPPAAHATRDWIQRLPLRAGPADVRAALGDAGFLEADPGEGRDAVADDVL